MFYFNNHKTDSTNNVFITHIRIYDLFFLILLKFILTLNHTTTNKMKITIPDKNRPEWTDIILGTKEYTYRNYVLQTNIHQLRREVVKEQKTIHQAIDELYELCSKYAIPVQLDFKNIFIKW